MLKDQARSLALQMFLGNQLTTARALSRLAPCMQVGAASHPFILSVGPCRILTAVNGPARAAISATFQACAISKEKCCVLQLISMHLTL